MITSIHTFFHSSRPSDCRVTVHLVLSYTKFYVRYIVVIGLSALFYLLVLNSLTFVEYFHPVTICHRYQQALFIHREPQVKRLISRKSVITLLSAELSGPLGLHSLSISSPFRSFGNYRFLLGCQLSVRQQTKLASNQLGRISIQT